MLQITRWVFLRSGVYDTKNYVRPIYCCSQTKFNGGKLHIQCITIRDCSIISFSRIKMSHLNVRTFSIIVWNDCLSGFRRCGFWRRKWFSQFARNFSASTSEITAEYDSPSETWDEAVTKAAHFMCQSSITDGLLWHLGCKCRTQYIT